MVGGPSRGVSWLLEERGCGVFMSRDLPLLTYLKVAISSNPGVSDLRPPLLHRLRNETSPADLARWQAFCCQLLTVLPHGWPGLCNRHRGMTPARLMPAS